MSRSRRAGIPRDEVRSRPLYARLLGLQYLRPSGFLCFVFLEGAVALGILLALAELVSWWGVLVLPVSVAAMVKVNDVIAGALTPATSRPPTRVARPAVRQVRTPVTGRSSVPAPPAQAQPPAAEGTSIPLPEGNRRAVGSARPVSGGPANVAGALDPPADSVLNALPPARVWTEPVPADSPHQWARQSASRRYE